MSKVKKYSMIFNEDFEVGMELKVIEKVCNILSRRIGTKISVSKVAVAVHSDMGKVEGIQGFLSDGRRIRFDFRLGTSSKVIAIHFWNGFKIQPDLTMPTDDKNIVHIIDAIEQVLNTGQPEEFLLTENCLNEDVVVASKTQGKISKEIADAVNAWSTDMNMGEDDLKNRRMKELYNSFRYWKSEVPSSGSFKDVSESAFRDYIIQYLAKYGITNIFMRKISVFKAGKEVTIDSDESENKKFDSEIMKMSLDDQIEFIKIMTRSVAQGKKNSLIICGTPGVGKSRTVKEIVNEEKGSRKVIWDAGLIKKADDLYKFLYKYKDKENLIIFDDTPVIENASFRPLLLSALSPEHERPISNRGEKFVDPNSLASLDTKKVLDNFMFEAGIIITTNVPKKKIDSAIASRTTPIELNVDKKAVVDSIRVNLHTILSEYKSFGEVSVEEATELLNFIEENLSVVDHIDFRLFKECLSMISIIPPSNMWKKYCITLLRNYR